MKKLTKILALALALAMMLGMTSMAATLYYKQDFTGYPNDEDAFPNTTLNDSLPLIPTAAEAFTYSRTANDNNFVAQSYIGSNWFYTRENAISKKMYIEHLGGSAGLVRSAYFLPDNEWEAKEGEAYVIAFDFEITSEDTEGHYNHLGVVGKKSDGSYLVSPVSGYRNFTLFSNYASYQDASIYNGNNKEENLAPQGTKPFALRFELNEEGGLKRSAYTTGTEGYACYYAGSTFELGDFTSIYGFGINSFKLSAGLGNIRMYTINTDIGLTATSDIKDKKDIPLSTNKVTLTFSEPVAIADIVVKADNEVVEGVTTDLRQVVSTDGTSIYSEVDVNFASDLLMGTEYSIDVSGVMNEVGDMCDAAPITFKTIGPDVDFKVYQGLTETSTEITDGNYAGKTVYVKATAENTNDISFDGKIIIGIYDASGTLVKYASATRSLAATNGNASFGASFKLAAGQTIRAEYK